MGVMLLVEYGGWGEERIGTGALTALCRPVEDVRQRVPMHGCLSDHRFDRLLSVRVIHVAHFGHRVQGESLVRALALVDVKCFVLLRVANIAALPTFNRLSRAYD